jgi:glycosyltransferase involved in cell wall biosynthesis
MPQITVIIPAYNEEEYIRKTLESLDKQTFRDFETIVVADSCTDNTAGIAKEYRCKVIRLNNKNTGKNRNAGAKKAKGDLLVFLDADVRVEADYLSKAHQAFKSGYDCGRPKYYYETKEFLIRNQLRVNDLLRIMHYPHTFFVSKELFIKAGKFDERFKNSMEDLEFSDRVNKLGKSCIIDSKVFNSTRRYDKNGFFIESLHQISGAAFYLIGYKFLKNRRGIEYPPIR